MFDKAEVLEMVEKATEKGFKFFSEKKYPQADMILNQVLKVNPDNIRALQMVGLIRHNAGRSEEAVGFFKTALQYEPDNSETHNNIALAYSNLGRYAAAIDHLERAVQISPDTAYLHANLGLQYRHAGQTDRAIEKFKHALRLKSDDPQTWCMLGGCYGETFQLDNAQTCFEYAVEVDPKFGPAHCDLASIHFMRGDWAKGWGEYEWRFETFDQVKFWLKLYDPAKRWYGEELLPGERIILHNEQGIGDSIHFFRYVPLLREKGAHVIMHCQEELRSLYEPLVDEVYTVDPGTIPLFEFRPTDYPMPAYDYFASLLSLPYLLGNPPIPETPYLNTNRRINLDAYSDYFKVGIVWAGNPQHPNDANRSCRLSRFRALHDLPGVKLFSLQKDKRLRQYRFMTAPVDLTEGCDDMRIVDLADQMTTFEDTAAILKSLDLLVSVDTSVVHLAGAMNVPAYALIPYNTDWRWKATGDTTDWYSSVRLFRQPAMGDWDSAFQNVLDSLKKELNVR